MGEGHLVQLRYLLQGFISWAGNCWEGKEGQLPVNNGPWAWGLWSPAGSLGLMGFAYLTIPLL